LRVLSKIGKIFTEYNYDSWAAFKDDGLEVETLLYKLGLSVEQTIPEDFFARNILIKSNSEDSFNISFYYSKIRDYIICYHSYRLDKLNDDELYNILEKFYENYVGQSAIAFYIKNGQKGTHHRMRT